MGQMLKLFTIETSAENLTFMQTVHQINKFTKIHYLGRLWSPSFALPQMHLHRSMLIKVDCFTDSSMSPELQGQLSHLLCKLSIPKPPKVFAVSRMKKKKSFQK